MKTVRPKVRCRVRTSSSKSPAPIDAAALRRTRRIEIDAEYFDTASDLRHEANDGPRQHRFSGARRADEPKDFAALDVEIEPVEHPRLAELHGDVANPDDGVGNFARHGHIPIDAKKMANTPSIP